MSGRRRIPAAERVDPLAALGVLDLPAPLREAITTLIAFGSRVGTGAAADGRTVARDLAGRLHHQLLKLPALFRGAVSADPAFTMLLALAADEDRGRPTTVSDLTHASGAPPTTALRHLDRLAARGLIARTGDEVDRRRTLVTLTDAGRTALREAMAVLFGLATA